MTVQEGIDMLNNHVPTGALSKINPSLTCIQVHKIVLDGIISFGKKHGLNLQLDSIFEKRVYQVVRNQRRPRF